MVAIDTRYLGATNNKPSRIVATSGNGHRLVVFYSTAEDSGGDPHECTAYKLCASLQWPNQLVGGGLKNSQVWVMLPRGEEYKSVTARSDDAFYARYFRESELVKLRRTSR